MGIVFSMRGTYRVDQDAMVEPGLCHEPFVHENGRYSLHPLRSVVQCKYFRCLSTRSSIFSCNATNLEKGEPEVYNNNKLLIDL